MGPASYLVYKAGGGGALLPTHPEGIEAPTQGSWVGGERPFGQWVGAEVSIALWSMEGILTIHRSVLPISPC